jgi:hypothetical protein
LAQRLRELGARTGSACAAGQQRGRRPRPHAALSPDGVAVQLPRVPRIEAGPTLLHTASNLTGRAQPRTPRG